jgi:hypothetical protein
MGNAICVRSALREANPQIEKVAALAALEQGSQFCAK